MYIIWSRVACYIVGKLKKNRQSTNTSTLLEKKGIINAAYGISRGIILFYMGNVQNGYA